MIVVYVIGQKPGLIFLMYRTLLRRVMKLLTRTVAYVMYATRLFVLA